MALIDTTKQFLDRYRQHDVEGMLTLFAPSGTIDYYPAELTGAATEAGREIWSSRRFSRPVERDHRSLPECRRAEVTSEVKINGTQAKDGFGIANKGRRYELPHLFILHGDDLDRIIAMKAYWDNAAWFRMLGKTSLD
jgi:ketosteroid isomerase-like protein